MSDMGSPFHHDLGIRHKWKETCKPNPEENNSRLREWLCKKQFAKTVGKTTRRLVARD